MTKGSISVLRIMMVLTVLLTSCGNISHTKDKNFMGESGAAEGTDVSTNAEAASLERNQQEPSAPFSMGDNLKAAITQLALTYESFSTDSTKSKEWKDVFVERFICNTRLTFDYLDKISNQNQGQISVDELNYIQSSLTNTQLDFSSYTDGTVNRYDGASLLNYGMISQYYSEETEDGIVVTGDLEIGYDGGNSTQKREITVKLIENPDSCFDGYSILSISSGPTAPTLAPDGKPHVFCAADMNEEENGVFLFEVLSAEDALAYAHFVSVDMRKLPEFAALVRENAGKDFKITFLWEEDSEEAIEYVIPTDVVLSR